MRGLDFVCATKDDYEEVTRILDDAATWHVEHAIDQWTPGAWSWGWIGEPIERGWTWLVREGGVAIGTMSLEDADPQVWPDAPADAMYVHRLALVRAARGRGLGGRILEWCDARVRDAGRRFVRLDCPRDNPKLRAYYEGLGFRHRGDVSLSGDWGSYHAAKYERAVV